MIDLGDFVDAELKKDADRVYHEQADKGAAYPYVVYKFPNSLDDEIREDFILEVDIWGKGPHTLPLEELAGQISRRLNRARHINGSVATTIFKTNQLAIPDPDVNIRRRQVRFECRTFFVK